MSARILLALLLAVGLSACSTIGGWFGSSSSEPKTKPAELTEFKQTAKLTRVWESDVGAGAPYTLSPATDGEAVYVASKSGRIARLDLATGKEAWRTESGRTLSAGVGVGEGLVLVGTPKGELLAFDSRTGNAAWTATLSGEILVPPVAADGAVAARSNDGNIWLFDAKDGKQRWVYSRVLPSLILRTPSELLFNQRGLFAGNPGGTLVGIALNNGAPAWETPVAVPKGATELERISDVTGPLAADDHVVCAAAYQGRIGCFDQMNGNPVWVRAFSGLSGVELADNSLYANDEHDMVESFGMASGALQWKQDALHDRHLTTPVVVSRFVAVADYQGYVHLLEKSSGQLAAHAPTDGSAVLGQPLALRSGMIVQTSNGTVVAFRIE
jgi:outer membrane protein assembly factor BamB